MHLAVLCIIKNKYTLVFHNLYLMLFRQFRCGMLFVMKSRASVSQGEKNVVKCGTAELHRAMARVCISIQAWTL